MLTIWRLLVAGYWLLVRGRPESHASGQAGLDEEVKLLRESRPAQHTQGPARTAPPVRRAKRETNVRIQMAPWNPATAFVSIRVIRGDSKKNCYRSKVEPRKPLFSWIEEP